MLHGVCAYARDFRAHLVAVRAQGLDVVQVACLDGLGEVCAEERLLLGEHREGVAVCGGLGRARGGRRALRAGRGEVRQAL